MPGLVLGVGVDTVDVVRFRIALERTPSMRRRLFVDVELADLANRADEVPGLAVRFAAREAAMKALGVGLGAFGFHEAWVRRGESGAPVLETVGRARELLERRGADALWVSLSHTDTTAIAVVVATRTVMDPPAPMASYASEP